MPTKKKPSRIWKAAEKDAAKRLGGERVSHRFRGESVCDVEHPLFRVEVKSRISLPALLRDAMEQAKTNAGDKKPMVVLHQNKSRHMNDIVCMRMADFVELFGDVFPAERDGEDE